MPFAGPQIHTVDGLYGVYVIGDQAVLRWGDSSQNRPLGVFAAFLTLPDQRLHSAPYFFDAGAGGLRPGSTAAEGFRRDGDCLRLYTASLQPVGQANAPAALFIEQRK